MTFTSLEEIEVWQKARSLAQIIYEQTQRGEFRRDFSLKDQINRAMGSVMDNIAEGFEREGNKEFIQFLAISKGSAGEVKSQLYRAKDRGHITSEDFEKFKDEIQSIIKQLKGFMNYLSRTDIKGSKYLHEPDVPYPDYEQ